jgi:hypothetical protein
MAFRVAISVIVATSASVLTTSTLDRASFAAIGAGTPSFEKGYVCYPGQFSGFKRTTSALRFRDVLAGESRTFRIGSPFYVCAPATSGPATDGRGYVVCYTTPALSLGVERRLASNFLGSLALPRTSRRDLICVDSDRVDQRVRSTISRVFVCYRSGEPSAGGRTVRVRDAFRRAEDAVVGVPYRGCAAPPALSAGTPSYLVCSPLSSGPPAGSVVLKNRFGFVKAVLGSRATLCVEP